MTENKVTMEDVYGPDPMMEILAGKMTLKQTVLEVVIGAKQKRRDKYKLACLNTVMAWHGIKPNDKLDLDMKQPVVVNIVEQAGCPEKPRTGANKDGSST